MFSKEIKHIHVDETKDKILNLIDIYSDEVIDLEEELNSERSELIYEEIENVRKEGDDEYDGWLRVVETHKNNIETFESKISHYKNLINKLTTKL